MGPAVSGGMPLRLSPGPYLEVAAAHVLKGEIEEAKAPLAEAPFCPWQHPTWQTQCSRRSVV